MTMEIWQHTSGKEPLCTLAQETRLTMQAMHALKLTLLAATHHVLAIRAWEQGEHVSTVG